ncbi:DUF1284 domain-containing protein [Litorivita pollutaquae]|uniref:DUF1284 domain-containing protein n=1 Tax=Litorivita pollutaquae TaxID=2200892 RepID=A0A2V4NEX3_9RHOB|nr:DUF1284 domain-containing protein [Litorivita pollutaquae]PYC48903.1 DUF1284 domain-containing protein [Litorivita pollutaquae]
MTIHLRAHHLLCILTYIGRGYTPAFTDNMTVIAGRISAGESIEIVEGPDEICAPRLAEANAHCFNDSVHNRDLQAAKDVGEVLQMPVHTGAKLSLDKDTLKRLRTAFAQDQVRSACHNCQWGELCTSISKNGYEGAIA